MGTFNPNFQTELPGRNPHLQSQPPGINSGDFRRKLRFGFSTAMMYEIIVARASLRFNLLTGFAAGLAIWTVPLALVALNSLFAWVATRSPAVWVPIVANASRLAPYILGSGVIGMILALLRRYSARTGKYFTVHVFTLGYNGVAATLTGFLVLVSLVFINERGGIFLWLLGIGAPILGFLADGVWLLFHDRIIALFRKHNTDILLSVEARNILRGYPGLQGFRLVDLSVTDRIAHVNGTWDGEEVRETVRKALRLVKGIESVEFHRVVQ